MVSRRSNILAFPLSVLLFLIGQATHAFVSHRGEENSFIVLFPTKSYVVSAELSEQESGIWLIHYPCLESNMLRNLALLSLEDFPAGFVLEAFNTVAASARP